MLLRWGDALIICEDGNEEHKDVEVGGSTESTFTPERSSIRLAIRFLNGETILVPWWMVEHLETVLSLLLAGY